MAKFHSCKKSATFLVIAIAIMVLASQRVTAEVVVYLRPYILSRFDLAEGTPPNETLSKRVSTFTVFEGSLLDLTPSELADSEVWVSTLGEFRVWWTDPFNAWSKTLFPVGFASGGDPLRVHKTHEIIVNSLSTGSDEDTRGFGGVAYYRLRGASGYAYNAGFKLATARMNSYSSTAVYGHSAYNWETPGPKFGNVIIVYPGPSVEITLSPVAEVTHIEGSGSTFEFEAPNEYEIDDEETLDDVQDEDAWADRLSDELYDPVADKFSAFGSIPFDDFTSNQSYVISIPMVNGGSWQADFSPLLFGVNAGSLAISTQQYSWWQPAQALSSTQIVVRVFLVLILYTTYIRSLLDRMNK